MDILEEGNLIDRVRILLQRDLSHYNQHQSVLQEKLCTTVIGGLLDFPHYTTFVASKVVTWWEQEYVITFKSPSSLYPDSSSILENNDKTSLEKSGTVSNLITLINETCEKVLQHLHTLSQEALDHADLSVLMGTIGAAALISNTLWLYDQKIMKTEPDMNLKTSLKKYKGMCEALAGRLLDLHNRLIALYILQDIDCLNWMSKSTFFEEQRSSFTVQMWWIYIQGTREELWSSVPPKIAIKVFSELINESLTIISMRYMQSKASFIRVPLLVADLSNVLLCMYHTLPYISISANELLGCKVTSYVIRDIHVKCHMILQTLILRASPLSTLYKVFKQEFDGIPCTKGIEGNSIEPWVIFAASQSNRILLYGTKDSSELPPLLSINYEFQILLSQPQTNWTLLLKVLLLNNCWVSYEIFQRTIDGVNDECENNLGKCNGFLCNNQCNEELCTVQEAIVKIMLLAGNSQDVSNSIIKVLEKCTNDWFKFMDKSQIWNQKRPLWIGGIISLIKPLVTDIIDMNSIQPSAICDAKSSELKAIKIINDAVEALDCIPEGVLILAPLLQNILPADTKPFGDSIVLQFLAITLYDNLGNESAISEAICRLSLPQLKETNQELQEVLEDTRERLHVCNNIRMLELQTDKLLTNSIGRSSLRILFNYMKNHCDWLKIKLGHKPKLCGSDSLLYKAFHIGDYPYDQVLSASWIPNWIEFLEIPLRLSYEEVKHHVSLRPEFWEDISMTEHDKTVVEHLRNLFDIQSPDSVVKPKTIEPQN